MRCVLQLCWQLRKMDINDLLLLHVVQRNNKNEKPQKKMVLKILQRWGVRRIQHSVQRVVIYWRHILFIGHQLTWRLFQRTSKQTLESPSAPKMVLQHVSLYIMFFHVSFLQPHICYKSLWYVGNSKKTKILSALLQHYFVGKCPLNQADWWPCIFVCILIACQCSCCSWNLS